MALRGRRPTTWCQSATRTHQAETLSKLPQFGQIRLRNGIRPAAEHKGLSTEQAEGTVAE
jgi:hypothetical protein